MSFGVQALGPGLLTYQWQKNAKDIAGATGPSWSIANVQASDAGTYSVRVGNSAGTVLSQDGLLTVKVPPALSFTSPLNPESLRKTGVPLSIIAQVSGSYTIQASTNVTTWLSLTNVTLSPGRFGFLDITATNYNRRFYRVILN